MPLPRQQLNRRPKPGQYNGAVACYEQLVSDIRRIARLLGFLFSTSVHFVEPAGRKLCPQVPIAMKTQGEIEAAVCEGIARFEQDFMGRGPEDIRAHLIGDLLVVRLRGVLQLPPSSSLSRRCPPRRVATCSSKFARS